MGRRKSLFKKNFKGETQAEYLARIYGTQAHAPLAHTNNMFFPDDWMELQADPELGQLIESIRGHEGQLREFRLRLQALQTEGPYFTCQHCSKGFYARAGAKYCSTKCRVAAHRARTA